MVIAAFSAGVTLQRAEAGRFGDAAPECLERRARPGSASLREAVDQHRDHNRLREVLRQRLTDGVITKLIDKWPNAGSWSNSS